MPSRSKAKRAKRDALKQRSVLSGQGHGQVVRVVTPMRNERPTFEQRIVSRTSRQLTAAKLNKRLAELLRRAVEHVPGVDVTIEGED